MKETQFNHLPSQGTIYSTTRLGNHLIIGTGDYGRVYGHISATDVQPIPLQNLPQDCEIISMDAFIDFAPVLAVAFVTKSSQNTYGALPDGRGRGFVTSHLNIYSTWISADQDSPTSLTSGSSSGGSKCKHTFHPKEEFHPSQFELLAQNCTSFQLNYIPYHLYHVPVLKQNGNFGNILLLSGSDKKIHGFEADDDNLTFVEVSTKVYFPELSQKFPAIVTRILIQPVNEITRRISLCGLQNGCLLIWIVSSKFGKRVGQDSESSSSSRSATPSKSNQDMAESVDSLEFSQSDKLNLDKLEIEEILHVVDTSNLVPVAKGDKDDNPDDASTEISESMSGSLDSFDESYDRLEHCYDGLITSIRSYVDGFSINVIVASALSPTYVYTNVIEEHFSKGTALKFSSRWDCVECCCVEDIDRDGENEIIIGTFGCVVLVYKYMDEILPAWVIVSKKKFPSTILSIEFVKPYLHVVSGLGLHIVEYNTAAYFSKKLGETRSHTPTDSFVDEKCLSHSLLPAVPTEIENLQENPTESTSQSTLPDVKPSEKP